MTFPSVSAHSSTHLLVQILIRLDTVGWVRVESHLEVPFVQLLHKCDRVWEQLLVPSARTLLALVFILWIGITTHV